MPGPPILKVVEVFASVQGEGLRQGEPTIFVRLAGCNLRCRFCDTKYAWRDGTDCSVEDVLREVRAARERHPAPWICLTGGEPLMQDVGPLVFALRGAGFRVQVETNGTLRRRVDFDWVTVSPKPPRYRVRLGLRREAAEVKLVASKELSLGAVRAVRDEFPPETPILIQPDSGWRGSVRKVLQLVDESLAAGIPNVRAACRLHKVFGIR